MLKISPAVTVNNVPGDFQNTMNSFTLFPDSEDKDTFYALAEQPTFLADARGNPSFSLLWYYGTRVQAGGICTMTVSLPLPNVDDPKIRTRILEAIRGDTSVSAIAKKTQALCEAQARGDTATAAALKKELGLDDAAATRLQKTWDKARDWDQFLPEGGSLKIRPIECKSGRVVVQAFANDDAYKNQKPEFTGECTTTPSLFNRNAAVVTYNLSDLGANLFWQGLGGWPLAEGKRPPTYDPKTGGNSSVISVTYQITFDGMLPDATATVTLSREVLAKLDIEKEVKTGAWGRKYTKDVVRGKAYDDAINSATQIVLPYTNEKDAGAVRTLLTDWAAAQLTSMTAAQFPGVSLADLDINGARKISSAQTQSRTYKLSQAVLVPKNPQAQLPRLDGLPEAVNKTLFRAVDLNEVPYVNVDVIVQPPPLAFLKARQVERFVVTQVSYAGQKLVGEDNREVGSIEYPTGAAQAASQKLKGTFSRDQAGKGAQYGYLVAYADGTPPMTVPVITEPGLNINLGGVDIGVLSVSLDSIDLPWDVVSSARVDLQYGDWEKTVALTNDGKQMLVTKPFGKAMDRQLRYRITLNLTGGSPVAGEYMEVPLRNGQAEITLRNPLGNMIDPLTFELGNGVTKAELRVEYTFRSSGPERVFAQRIALDAGQGGGRVVWKVPRQSDAPGALRVTKARVTTASGTKDLADLSQGKLDPLESQSSITVLPDGLSNF